MQKGHSKDHRPDLPQLKLMAAAVQPGGLCIACDVHAGHKADDPLYTPVITRVRQITGQSGLLYAGDCKMAALATRAELAAHGDFYLMPLPLTQETAVQFEHWIGAVVDGPQVPELIWHEDKLLGAAGLLVKREPRCACALLSPPSSAITPPSQNANIGWGGASR